jgi:plasmid stabilization system protein ParE
MAKRIVEWTQTAIRQRRSILKYWTVRNGSTTYAEKIIRISEKHTKSISENPLTFRTTEFPDTHVAAMGHFSIYYKITDLKIYVTAFWDNRQDPKKLVRILNK